MTVKKAILTIGFVFWVIGVSAAIPMIAFGEGNIPIVGIAFAIADTAFLAAAYYLLRN